MKCVSAYVKGVNSFRGKDQSNQYSTTTTQNRNSSTSLTHSLTHLPKKITSSNSKSKLSTTVAQADDKIR